MRRSSIGLPLQPSDSPPDLGGDVPFDDDRLFDGGADAEEPESPTTPSKQPQTPRRRAAPSNAVQDSEDTGTPKARSKSKAKERDEDHDGEEVEALEDAEVPQEDEEKEATPVKKPKRSRKRAVEVLCKKPFAMVQPSC
jgi:hypothetical protein